MDDKLLVRIYNVGLGDCIYIQVPDGNTARHILIDCGNKYSDGALLEEALVDLKKNLPKVGDKRSLDLLVVTHPHEDHVKGFDSSEFDDIKIERMWMSSGMDEEHPQLKKLRAFSGEAMARFQAAASTPALREMGDALFELNKKDAMTALMKDLPAQNGIKPAFVHADWVEKEPKLFTSDKVALKVLAPMENIDKFYLGDLDADLQAFAGLNEAHSPPEGPPPPEKVPEVQPANISARDFGQLRNRLTNNWMKYFVIEGHLVNNLSVVLLLEWHGRRLLFTGDAEVKLSRKGQFALGKSNASWNVMWDQRRAELNRPIDFLKVGHHGSVNATPYTTKRLRGDKEHPVNQMLRKMLPDDDKKNERWAIASTKRTTGYETIPDPALMKELGTRVGNVSLYAEPAVKGVAVAADVPQPQRTDMERKLFLQVKFEPV